MSNFSIRWDKKLNAKEISNKNFDRDTMYFIHSTFWKLYFPYVPYGESGNLSEGVQIDENGINHNVPYASRQYYGESFNFRTDMHPLACAKWDEVCLANGGKEKLVSSTNKYLLRKGK